VGVAGFLSGATVFLPHSGQKFFIQQWGPAVGAEVHESGSFVWGDKGWDIKKN